MTGLSDMSSSSRNLRKSHYYLVIIIIVIVFLLLLFILLSTACLVTLDLLLENFIQNIREQMTGGIRYYQITEEMNRMRLDTVGDDEWEA